MRLHQHVRGNPGSRDPGDEFIANNERTQQFANGTSIGFSLRQQNGNNVGTSMARCLSITFSKLQPLRSNAVRYGRRVSITLSHSAAIDRCLDSLRPGYHQFVKIRHLWLIARCYDGAHVVCENSSSPCKHRR